MWRALKSIQNTPLYMLELSYFRLRVHTKSARWGWQIESDTAWQIKSGEAATAPEAQAHALDALRELLSREVSLLLEAEP